MENKEKIPVLVMGHQTYHPKDQPIILSFDDSPAQVRIGRYCSISYNVTCILGGNHRYDWVTTYPFARRADFDVPDSIRKSHPFPAKGIDIGHDVWIGYGVTIMDGVKIGSGAIIGASSIVTHEVPPYTVWAGNPAKYIRNRFRPEQIQFLLEIAWWNWPEAKINEFIPLLCSGNIDLFIEVAKSIRETEVSNG